MAKKKRSTAPKTSTGGQWLAAWQKANPGMFQPGVTMAQAQSIVPEYRPDASGDPAWIAAMIAQRSGGAGGGAAAGAAAPAAVGGDPAAPGPLPQYAPSSWLAGMRSMAADQGDQIGLRKVHDQQRLDYLSGLGAGADNRNRFSQMNLLNRAFGRELVGLQTDAAVNGQLYSGQYEEGVNDSQFNRSQGQYGLEQTHLDQSEGINRAAQDANAQNAQQLQGAEMTDRDNWLNTIRSIGTGK